MLLHFFAFFASFVLIRASDTSSSSSLRGVAISMDDAMEAEELIHHGHRSLALLEAIPCPMTVLPTLYFNLTFNFAPDEDIGSDLLCTSEAKLELGDAINEFLLDFGVGKAGAHDNIMFLAEVCPMPIERNGPDGNRRQLSSRTSSSGTTGSSMTSRGLVGKANGFRYAGGGGCKFCADDDNDKRRQLWILNPKKSWFNTVFKPFMETILEIKFIVTVAAKYPQCLGKDPMLAIKVNEVKRNPQTEC